MKRLELGHVEALRTSLEGVEHPLARAMLESVVQDSLKHAAIAGALVETEGAAWGPAVNLRQNIKQHIRVEAQMVERLESMAGSVEDPRVGRFLAYLAEEERRHHGLLTELSGLLDMGEYLGLFQKYMVVPPEGG